MSEAEDDKDLQELKQKWIEQFEDLGEENIAEKIESNELEKVLDDGFYSNLQSLTNDDKTISYLESFQNKVENKVGYSDKTKKFPLDKFEHLTNKRIAQEMAEFAVYQKKIIPVDMGVGSDDDKVVFLQYQPGEGVWSKLSRTQMGVIIKEMAGKMYSTHLGNEVFKNLKHHKERERFEEFGLPQNEVLVNGGKVLDIFTEEVRDVEATDGALYKIDVDYDPEAECKSWRRFVNKLLDDDELQVKTLQEYMGYLLKYPNRDHQKALLMLGVSNSGKSQIADFLSELFDEDAMSNVSIGQLGMDRRFHVHRLGDSVLNIDRDMSSTFLKSEDTLKQLISQETLAAEPKGEGTIEIDPRAKFFICSNVSPRVDSSADAAFFDRFLTLVCPHEVPRSERIPDYGLKLFEREGAGIFNWMLEGLHRLEENGRFTRELSPYETRMLWNRYGGSVQQFVWECLERSDGDEFVSSRDLYEHYCVWVEDKLMNQVSRNRFSQELNEQPFVRKTVREASDGKRRRVFKGVSLKSAVPAVEEG